MRIFALSIFICDIVISRKWRTRPVDPRKMHMDPRLRTSGVSGLVVNNFEDSKIKSSLLDGHFCNQRQRLFTNLVCCDHRARCQSSWAGRLLWSWTASTTTTTATPRRTTSYTTPGYTRTAPSSARSSARSREHFNDFIISNQWASSQRRRLLVPSLY